MTDKPEDVASEALKMLHTTMRQAFRAPAKGNLDQKIALRNRYIEGLMYFSYFLKMTGAGKDVAQRIAELASALSDLNGGTTHPLLQAEVFNRPVDRSDLWGCRASVAIALEYILASGVSLTMACDNIAKHFPGLSMLCRPDKVGRPLNLASSIKSWRRGLTNRSIKSETALASFHEVGMASLDQLKAHLSKDELASGAARLLASAEVRARSLLPGAQE